MIAFRHFIINCSCRKLQKASTSTVEFSLVTYNTHGSYCGMCFSPSSWFMVYELFVCQFSYFYQSYFVEVWSWLTVEHFSAFTFLFAACLIQRTGWTKDVDLFLQWLSSIPFIGGGFNDAAIAEGLSEALMV